MQPGPNNIYKCPHCGHFLKERTLLSGNTCEAMFYSDGKRIAPMLPEFPDLTKCKKCNHIFWLSIFKIVGQEDCWNPDSKWADAECAEFLNIKDLFRALEMYPKKEKDIRIWILWTFNDRIRNGKEIFIDPDDKDLWEQNSNALLKLFDDSNLERKFLKAELYRNLGEFEKCIDIIESINVSGMKEDDAQWVKSLKGQMKNMAEQKDRLVFITSEWGEDRRGGFYSLDKVTEYIIYERLKKRTVNRESTRSIGHIKSDIDMITNSDTKKISCFLNLTGWCLNMNPNGSIEEFIEDLIKHKWILDLKCV